MLFGHAFKQNLRGHKHLEMFQNNIEYCLIHNNEDWQRLSIFENRINVDLP